MSAPPSSLLNKNTGPIKIVKVPLDEEVSGPKSNNFSSMPQLYLELLENKEKIKQGLLNREYEPDDNMSDISYFQGSSRQQYQPQDTRSSMGEIQEEEDELLSRSSGESSTSSPPQVRKEKETLDDDLDDDEVQDDDDTEVDDDDDVDENDDDDDEDIENRENREDRNIPYPARKNNFHDDHEDDEDLLSDSSLLQDSYKPSAPAPVRRDVGGMPEAYDKMLAPRPTTPAPPRLADLKKTGEYVDTGKSHTPDLHRIYSKSSQEEEEIKREILFKFEILKKSYRNIDIPNFTIHTDLATLSRSYENTLRRVSLDTNVESYKQYLIGGFMLVEFVVSNWLGLDMQGFAQQQMLNMVQYERLLIELGERSYVPGGKSWPVEVRLLGMILMNAFIFIISKIILKKTGNNVMNMMNAFSQPNKVGSSGTGNTTPSSTGSTTGTAGATTPGTDDKGRRRMRGPMIDPDDIPDLTNSSTLS